MDPVAPPSAADGAVRTAWRVAREFGYPTEDLAVAEIVEEAGAVTVLLGRPRAGRAGWSRGGGLLVVVDAETGDVRRVQPQR
jgi:hypothetical protein